MSNWVLGIGIRKLYKFIGSTVRLEYKYASAGNMYGISNNVREGLKIFAAALNTKCKYEKRSRGIGTCPVQTKLLKYSNCCKNLKGTMDNLFIFIVALDGLRLYVVIKCRLCMWRGRMFYTE
jgi:hypothetical protein